MKLSLFAALIALLIFTDACTRGAPPDEPVPLETAATCANFMKGKTQMNLKQVLTCATVMCATYPTACQPPQPKPPTPDAGTGGSGPIVATGGGPATGGGSATGGASGLSPLAKCTAAKAKDASVQNVAKQTGQSVSALVKTICADPTILGGYN